MATRGRRSAAAAAARAGSMWPSPDRRSPAPHREERRVQRAGELVHGREQVRVAGEVDRSRAADDAPIAGPVGPNGTRLPECSAYTTSSSTRSIVSRSPGSTSSTGPSPSLAAMPPNPRGHDDGGLAGDPAQRRLVEVVVVPVADEHGIEVREQLRQHVGHLAAHRAEAVPQDRVGEDPQVVDLDEHRRVAEERQPPVRRARRLGRHRRPDRAPRLVHGGGSIGHGPMVTRRPRDRWTAGVDTRHSACIIAFSIC